MKEEIKANKNWISFLVLGLTNWVLIVDLYRYAIKGEINLWWLLIITIVLVIYGFFSLEVAKEYYKNKES